MHILRCYAEDSIGYKLQRNKTEEGNYTMLENLNSYLDDPIDGNKQDDEVEIDLLEIFNVLKSKFLILLNFWYNFRLPSHSPLPFPRHSL